MIPVVCSSIKIHLDLFKILHAKEWVLEFIRVFSNCLGKESKILPYTHVLDLAGDGYIKPHVDSVRVSIVNSKSLSDCEKSQNFNLNNFYLKQGFLVY